MSQVHSVTPLPIENPLSHENDNNRRLLQRSGYSSVTGRVPLQTIRPARNDFRVGSTSMVGAQATKV